MADHIRQTVRLEASTDTLRIVTAAGRIYDCIWAGSLDRDAESGISCEGTSYYLRPVPTYRGIEVPLGIAGRAEVAAFEMGVDRAIEARPR